MQKSDKSRFCIFCIRMHSPICWWPGVSRYVPVYDTGMYRLRLVHHLGSWHHRYRRYRRYWVICWPDVVSHVTISGFLCNPISGYVGWDPISGISTDIRCNSISGHHVTDITYPISGSISGSISGIPISGPATPDSVDFRHNIWWHPISVLISGPISGIPISGPATPDIGVNFRYCRYRS